MITHKSVQFLGGASILNFIRIVKLLGSRISKMACEKKINGAINRIQGGLSIIYVV